MEKAKRARKAETPRQPSLCLRLRAPYLYPDRADSAKTAVAAARPARLHAPRIADDSGAPRKSAEVGHEEMPGTLMILFSAAKKL